jgi:hypothetical protein
LKSTRRKLRRFAFLEEIVDRIPLPERMREIVIVKTRAQGPATTLPQNVFGAKKPGGKD